MSDKVQQIVDQLKELSLVEASELVKAIEDTFDVSASAPAAVAAAPAAQGGEEAAQEEEQTEFNVKVTEVPGDKKIAVIKAVKNILGVGLADAKKKVEEGEFVVAESVSKEDANKYKEDLTTAGASVALE
jgi:large subunit ribosomal protein L7/L12